MINCFLLLACLLFSFACNLIRKIYDNQSYSSTRDMIKNAFLSGIAGFFCSLFLSEFIVSPILLIILSGIGGFFGIQGFELLTKYRFGDSNISQDFQSLINEDQSINDPNQTQTQSQSQSSAQANTNQTHINSSTNAVNDSINDVNNSANGINDSVNNVNINMFKTLMMYMYETRYKTCTEHVILRVIKKK